MFDSNDLPEFLSDRELNLMLFGGKGGVGKTTSAVAAALFLANASPENQILLVSTDPAHSVRDCLADLDVPANLEVVELDAATALDKFKTEHGEKLREIARRGTFLEDEDINRFFDLSLPGLDELMAFLEITRWTESGDFSKIVVDTAPTGHTLRLLEMPVLLEKWLKVLDSLLAKRRYMIQLYRQSYQADEIDQFLLDLNARVKTLEKLLRDETRCRFVPVCLAEQIVIEETADLLEKLDEQNIAVREIIVNRLLPANDCRVCQQKRARQTVQLEFLPEIFRRYKLRQVELFAAEMRGRSLVSGFRFQVSDLKKAENLNLHNLKPALSEAKFQIFAGKGGVGKTTLACATALRLAREFPAKRILLFSTDPAHSVADCLNVEVDANSTAILPNLSALQVDASVEFAGLKTLYASEVKKMLTNLMPDLDLTFDADVMERLLDLSPPGIDEAMALTRVLEIYKKGECDVLVLDSAPTGHLLRLLEMPELLDSWLKTVFHLLIKYKEIFRVPNLSNKLVEISRNLKVLRALWRDAAQTKLFAVSILTEMAFEETTDLILSTENLGVSVGGIFLNLATKSNECGLCAAVAARENHIVAKFAAEFEEISQTLIYYREETNGVDALETLGAELYETNYAEAAI